MDKLIKMLKKPYNSLKSAWGHHNITISPEDLIKLKQGETLYINIMDEYSVFVSIGKETSCEVEV